MLLHSLIRKIPCNCFTLLKTVIRKILEETVVLKDAKSGYDHVYPDSMFFLSGISSWGWSVLLASKTYINILLDPGVYATNFYFMSFCTKEKRNHHKPWKIFPGYKQDQIFSSHLVL